MTLLTGLVQKSMDMFLIREIREIGGKKIFPRMDDSGQLNRREEKQKTSVSSAHAQASSQQFVHLCLLFNSSAKLQGRIWGHWLARELQRTLFLSSSFLLR